MAYCRFSSDDWQCDVYCYASVSGAWVTHVAAVRHVGELPHRGAWAEFIRGRISPSDYAAIHAEQMRFLDESPREPIGLPFDGQSFDDVGPLQCRARLIELRALGYRFPDAVLAELAAEGGGVDE
jgi:hypothetical protein